MLVPILADQCRKSVQNHTADFENVTKLVRISLILYLNFRLGHYKHNFKLLNPI